mmetsp:Transcript_83701/g.245422  ORF Transcript_83701/g.245422 Transcript_83701/m.245422 type:complete len:123 (-) Transcript_83701:30-398(-)
MTRKSSGSASSQGLTSETPGDCRFDFDASALSAAALPVLPMAPGNILHCLSCLPQHGHPGDRAGHLCEFTKSSSLPAWANNTAPSAKNAHLVPRQRLLLPTTKALVRIVKFELLPAAAICHT